MLFKLVLGLGNNSYSQIEELCEIYSRAGADIFDLSPNIESILAARRGIERAAKNVNFDAREFKFCVSFGVPGDIHTKKARVIECNNCGYCLGICPQDAIALGVVDEKKCIGCKKCENGCIEFYDNVVDIESVAMDLRDKVDMVELHISTPNKDEILSSWEKILDNFDCQKSICLDQSKFDEEFIKKLLSMNPNRTIIQADGVPMSGMENVESTRAAVIHALLYKNFDVDIFISGGTNIYTRKLADELGVRANGITIGTYARMNKHKAKEIVDSVKFPSSS